MPSLAVGEVFPVMCQALMRCAQKDGYSLVLGDISASTPSKRAIEAGKVARSFVKQRVAGVVLQPLAFLRAPERVTREILMLFDNAEIPVVLIDRNISLGQDPVRHDFVGIDNFSAGRALGEHMMHEGAKRVRFLMRPNCATVIRDRLDGAASALGLGGDKDFKIVAEPDDIGTLGLIFKKRTRPDAVICESDYVAAVFRNTLDKLGLSVPRSSGTRLTSWDSRSRRTYCLPALTTFVALSPLSRSLRRSTSRARTSPSLPIVRLGSAFSIRRSRRGR